MPALGCFADFVADKDLPSSKRNVVLVTEGTAGAGKASVEALAKHEPEHIYITGRNSATADSLITKLTAEHPGLRLTFLHMNLSSLQGVKAAPLIFTNDRLDILMRNADVLDVPYSLTVDGFQTVMATNRLGHAMLIRQLLPVFLRTARTPEADVRIVILTSDENVCHPRRATGYGQSKLSNLVYASKLAHRYPDILSVSVQPGCIATDMVNNTRWFARMGTYLMNRVQGIHALPSPKSCFNRLRAAAGAKRCDMVNGAYCTPVEVVRQVDKVASRRELGEKL
ncbi:NAD(P)-binding protein [Xylariaceae sp. AK1471]|nr:NAD(P)-binding protein [Xylariaceae sp. AK1471]